MFSVSSLEAAACTTSALNHLLSLLPRMAESRAQLIKADHVPSTGTKKCASFVLSPANVERGLIFRVRPSQCILGNTRHRPNVGPMLVQRLRRWPNISPTLSRCIWVRMLGHLVWLTGDQTRQCSSFLSITAHYSSMDDDAALQANTIMQNISCLYWPAKPEGSNCLKSKQLLPFGFAGHCTQACPIFVHIAN